MYGYTKKLVVMVTGSDKGGEGSMVVGAVCHIVNDDNTGEFDPYFIERIKNALQMMRNKRFVEVIEADVSDNHTFKV